MNARRVRHVGFVVRNIEKSLGFYRDLLGFIVYDRRAEEGDYIDSLVGIKNVKVDWVKLSLPDGGLVELLEYRSHPDPAASGDVESLPSNKITSGHVALTVVDLDGLYKKLTEKGYHCTSAPLLMPSKKSRVLYCNDPDGIILELIEDIQ